jgi:hypothetical protein
MVIGLSGRVSNMPSALPRRFYLCFAVLVSLWFADNAQKHITSAAILYDAHQNANIAFNLVHTGAYSYAKKPTSPPHPTMKREPVPILAIAAFLAAHPSFKHPYNIVDLEDGRLTRTVKLVNVFWEFLAALFIFLLCAELFPNPIIAGVGALIALAISDMTFLSIGDVVDTLLSELPAAVLLLATSWCAVRFVRHESNWRAISFGIAMGLLALTKAAFFSVGIAFILLLLLLDRRKLVRRNDAASRQLRAAYALLALAFLATLSPWLLRNAVSLGRPEMIAGRGEKILGMRMLLTELPPLGLVYASSPPPLMQKLGPLLGYTPADLEAGGSLNIIRTLNRRPLKGLFHARMEAEGYAGTTEQWLRRSMLFSMVKDPLGYLTSVGLFAYRGMWFMQPSGMAGRLDPLTFYALSALSLFSLLGVFFGGLIAGNRVLVAAFGLAAGVFVFHAALSHGLPRYNAPSTPLVIIAVLWICVALGGYMLRLRERSQSIRHQFAD